MELDLKTIPFSRYGSYFVISQLKEGKYTLRDIHGGDMSPSELFHFNFFETVDDERKELESIHAKADETAFVFTHPQDESKQARVSFPTPTDCLIESNGLEVSLDAEKVRYDTFYATGSDAYYYVSYKKEMKYGIATENVTVEAPWDRVGNHFIQIMMNGNEGTSRVYLKGQRTEAELDMMIPDWDEAQAEIKAEFENWKKELPQVPTQFEASRDLAGYLLWGNVVHAEGVMKSDVTYMSKNHMQNIWSWDNCFSGMGMAKSHPELAFNQYQVFMDHQADNGAYPDFMNDLFVSYNCVKPPIHAWAYKEMGESNDLFYKEEKLLPIFESIEKSTHYWMNERRLDDSGLPFYTHGNDSGWDNASIFHHGMPVAAPELAAYLVRQMDILSEFAEKLGQSDKATYWTEEADKMYKLLMDQLYDGKQFRAKKLGKDIYESDLPTRSLILNMTLVLSYRYPKEVTEKIVQALADNHETKFGLTTEELDSPYYVEDGYWQGPIWAPVTYIAIDALYKAGYTEMADRLAEKFCELTLVGGMAENYNAETGTGNDDLAFTWPSAVFLLLGEKLIRDK